MSSIISKARDKVRTYYGFSGEPDIVREDVAWLLTKSHFAYGGVDLRVFAFFDNGMNTDYFSSEADSRWNETIWCSDHHRHHRSTMVSIDIKIQA